MPSTAIGESGSLTEFAEDAGVGEADPVHEMGNHAPDEAAGSGSHGLQPSIVHGRSAQDQSQFRVLSNSAFLSELANLAGDEIRRLMRYSVKRSIGTTHGFQEDLLEHTGRTIEVVLASFFEKLNDYVDFAVERVEQYTQMGGAHLDPFDLQSLILQRQLRRSIDHSRELSKKLDESEQKEDRLQSKFRQLRSQYLREVHMWKQKCLRLKNKCLTVCIGSEEEVEALDDNVTFFNAQDHMDDEVNAIIEQKNQEFMAKQQVSEQILHNKISKLQHQLELSQAEAKRFFIDCQSLKSQLLKEKKRRDSEDLSDLRNEFDQEGGDVSEVTQVQVNQLNQLNQLNQFDGGDLAIASTGIFDGDTDTISKRNFKLMQMRVDDALSKLNAMHELNDLYAMKIEALSRQREEAFTSPDNKDLSPASPIDQISLNMLRDMKSRAERVQSDLKTFQKEGEETFASSKTAQTDDFEGRAFREMQAMQERVLRSAEEIEQGLNQVSVLTAEKEHLRKMLQQEKAEPMRLRKLLKESSKQSHDDSQTIKIQEKTIQTLEEEKQSLEAQLSFKTKRLAELERTDTDLHIPEGSVGVAELPLETDTVLPEIDLNNREDMQSEHEGSRNSDHDGHASSSPRARTSSSPVVASKRSSMSSKKSSASPCTSPAIQSNDGPDAAHGDAVSEDEGNPLTEEMHPAELNDEESSSATATPRVTTPGSPRAVDSPRSPPNASRITSPAKFNSGSIVGSRQSSPVPDTLQIPVGSSSAIESAGGGIEQVPVGELPYDTGVSSQSPSHVRSSINHASPCNFGISDFTTKQYELQRQQKRRFSAPPVPNPIGRRRYLCSEEVNAEFQGMIERFEKLPDRQPTREQPGIDLEDEEQHHEDFAQTAQSLRQMYNDTLDKWSSAQQRGDAHKFEVLELRKRCETAEVQAKLSWEIQRRSLLQCQRILARLPRHHEGFKIDGHLLRTDPYEALEVFEENVQSEHPHWIVKRLDELRHAEARAAHHRSIEIRKAALRKVKALMPIQKCMQANSLRAFDKDAGLPHLDLERCRSWTWNEAEKFKNFVDRCETLVEQSSKELQTVLRSDESVENPEAIEYTLSVMEESMQQSNDAGNIDIEGDLHSCEKIILLEPELADPVRFEIPNSKKLKLDTHVTESVEEISLSVDSEQASKLQDAVEDSDEDVPLENCTFASTKVLAPTARLAPCAAPMGPFMHHEVEPLEGHTPIWSLMPELVKPHEIEKITTNRAELTERNAEMRVVGLRPRVEALHRHQAKLAAPKKRSRAGFAFADWTPPATPTGEQDLELLEAPHCEAPRNISTVPEMHTSSCSIGVVSVTDVESPKMGNADNSPGSLQAPGDTAAGPTKTVPAELLNVARESGGEVDDAASDKSDDSNSPAGTRRNLSHSNDKTGSSPSLLRTNETPKSDGLLAPAPPRHRSRSKSLMGPDTLRLNERLSSARQSFSLAPDLSELPPSTPKSEANNQFPSTDLSKKVEPVLHNTDLIKKAEEVNKHRKLLEVFVKAAMSASKGNQVEGVAELAQAMEPEDKDNICEGFANVIENLMHAAQPAKVTSSYARSLPDTFRSATNKATAMQRLFGKPSTREASVQASKEERVMLKEQGMQTDMQSAERDESTRRVKMKEMATTTFKDILKPAFNSKKRKEELDIAHLTSSALGSRGNRPVLPIQELDSLTSEQAGHDDCVDNNLEVSKPSGWNVDVRRAASPSPLGSRKANKPNEEVPKDTAIPSTEGEAHRSSVELEKAKFTCGTCGKVFSRVTGILPHKCKKKKSPAKASKDPNPPNASQEHVPENEDTSRIFESVQNISAAPQVGDTANRNASHTLENARSEAAVNTAEQSQGQIPSSHENAQNEAVLQVNVAGESTQDKERHAEVGRPFSATEDSANDESASDADSSGSASGVGKYEYLNSRASVMSTASDDGSPRGPGARRFSEVDILGMMEQLATEVVDCGVQTELDWDSLVYNTISWLRLNLFQRQQARMYCGSWITSELEDFSIACPDLEKVVKEFEDFLLRVLALQPPARAVQQRKALRRHYRDAVPGDMRNAADRRKANFKQNRQVTLEDIGVQRVNEALLHNCAESENMSKLSEHGSIIPVMISAEPSSTDNMTRKRSDATVQYVRSGGSHYRDFSLGRDAESLGVPLFAVENEPLATGFNYFTNCRNIEVRLSNLLGFDLSQAKLTGVHQDPFCKDYLKSELTKKDLDGSPLRSLLEPTDSLNDSTRLSMNDEEFENHLLSFAETDIMDSDIDPFELNPTRATQTIIKIEDECGLPPISSAEPSDVAMYPFPLRDLPARHSAQSHGREDWREDERRMHILMSRIQAARSLQRGPVPRRILELVEQLTDVDYELAASFNNLLHDTEDPQYLASQYGPLLQRISAEIRSEQRRWPAAPGLSPFITNAPQTLEISQKLAADSADDERIQRIVASLGDLVANTVRRHKAAQPLLQFGFAQLRNWARRLEVKGLAVKDPAEDVSSMAQQEEATLSHDIALTPRGHLPQAQPVIVDVTHDLPVARKPPRMLPQIASGAPDKRTANRDAAPQQANESEYIGAVAWSYRATPSTADTAVTSQRLSGVSPSYGQTSTPTGVHDLAGDRPVTAPEEVDSRGRSSRTPAGGRDKGVGYSQHFQNPPKDDRDLTVRPITAPAQPLDAAGKGGLRSRGRNFRSAGRSSAQEDMPEVAVPAPPRHPSADPAAEMPASGSISVFARSLGVSKAKKTPSGVQRTPSTSGGGIGGKPC